MGCGLRELGEVSGLGVRSQEWLEVLSEADQRAVRTIAVMLEESRRAHHSITLEVILKDNKVTITWVRRQLLNPGDAFGTSLVE